VRQVGQLPRILTVWSTFIKFVWWHPQQPLILLWNSVTPNCSRIGKNVENVEQNFTYVLR